MSKEESGDGQAVWIECGNCKQGFTGALDLEMARGCWRRNRSSQDRQRLLYFSTRNLATSLGFNDEIDAANQLLDEASTYVGNNTGALLDLKLVRAGVLIKNGQNLEALGRLQAMLPEAKLFVLTKPGLYFQALRGIVQVCGELGRYQEAHEIAAEATTFGMARFGPEHQFTLEAKEVYAQSCIHLDGDEEAMRIWEEILTIQTRVFGCYHPSTQNILRCIHHYGFTVKGCTSSPAGATAPGEDPPPQPQPPQHQPDFR